MVCTEKSTPGRTVWRMHAAERFANTSGIMQGGLVAAFADSAMGASAVTFLEGRKAFVVNAELKVSFLKAVRIGSTLTCTASVVSGGRRVSFLEAEVADDDGRMVLKASSTYVYTDRE
jgi:uncharacterized protein (TIGR00369 family)